MKVNKIFFFHHRAPSSSLTHAVPSLTHAVPSLTHAVPVAEVGLQSVGLPAQLHLALVAEAGHELDVARLLGHLHAVGAWI